MLLQNTEDFTALSASSQGINISADSAGGDDPAALLSSITFTINDQTKSLADILSGYVSRQYVDDMIGDLEHLLETT